MNDDLEMKLYALFVPGVKTKLKESGIDTANLGFSVQFVEGMPEVSGVRYELTVIINGQWILSDFLDLAETLNEYCTNEERVTLAGHEFLLGDGDDLQAVWFAGGLIHIWLRGWK